MTNARPTTPHDTRLPSHQHLTLVPGEQERRDPADNALAELNRLVTDLFAAHVQHDHLRALSDLVAMQPLLNHLMSLKQPLIEHRDSPPAPHEEQGYL